MKRPNAIAPWLLIPLLFLASCQPAPEEPAPPSEPAPEIAAPREDDPPDVASEAEDVSGFSGAEAGAGDPFKGPAAVPKEKRPRRPPENLRMMVEVFRVPQARADQLVKMASHVEIYRALSELQEDGEAELETLLAANTKNRSEMSVESVVEYRHPTKPLFAEYEVENLGESMRATIRQLADDGAFNLEFSVEIVSLERLDDVAEAEGVVSRVPVFHVSSISTRLDCREHEPVLLGASTRGSASGDRPPEGEPMARMFFGRVTTDTFDPPEEGTVPEVPVCRIVFAIYSVDLLVAQQMLREARHSRELHPLLQARLEAGEAKLVHLHSITSGNAAEATDGDTYTYFYPTEFKLPEPADGVVLQSKLETRDLGWKLTTKPLIKDGVYDFAFYPEHVWLLKKEEQGGTLGRQVWQPVFATQRCNTRIFAELGQPTFFGTMSPAMNTGFAEVNPERKVWLGFVTIMRAE